MATSSGHVPARHVFRGLRGDGIPHTETRIVFTFTEVIDKADWAAFAQVRQSLDASQSLYDYTLTLEDNSDDPSLTTSQLRVIVPRVPASVTSTWSGNKVGDLKLQKTGEEPTTWIIFDYRITKDATRV